MKFSRVPEMREIAILLINRLERCDFDGRLTAEVAVNYIATLRDDDVSAALGRLATRGAHCLNGLRELYWKYGAFPPPSL